MPVLAFFTWFLWIVPAVTGAFARRMGRPYWTWFLLGCILPVISGFILFFLPDKSVE